MSECPGVALAEAVEKWFLSPPGVGDLQLLEAFAEYQRVASPVPGCSHCFPVPSESPDTQAEAGPFDEPVTPEQEAQIDRVMTGWTPRAEPDGEACLCGGDGVRYTVGADADCPMHGFPRCKPHGQRQCATCAAPAQDGAEVTVTDVFVDRLRQVEALLLLIAENDWPKAKALLAQRDKDRDAAVAAKVGEQIAQEVEAKYLGADCGRQYDGRESPDAALQNAYDEGLETAAAIARAAGDERE